MEPRTDRIPHLAPGVEVGPDRAPGANVTVAAPPERYFEVSPATARLLRAIDGRRSIAELAHLVANDASPLGAPELADLIDHLLIPRGVVHFGTPPAPGSAPPSRLRLRVPLIPAPWVNAITPALAWLFRAPVAIAAIVAALAAHAWFYVLTPDLGPSFRLDRLAGWAAPVALFALVTLLHEFGHAAALRSRGERAGDIGFGIYWIWPVLFSDLSRAWRLVPRARAVVDAGGILVQLVSAAVLIAAWGFARQTWMARAITLVDLGLIANLNPLLRWDGYWLLADLTGVTDLRRRSLAQIGALLRGGRSQEPAWVTLYAVLSIAALLASLAWVALVVVPRVLR